MIDIIDIPFFALFSLFLYLGPSEFYSIHLIHLDLSILRHFQVVRKQLVKVVLILCSVDDLRRWQSSSEVRDGFLNYLGCILSFLTILHSIMLNFDWVYDKYFVYRGKTKHLWQALTNGLHAAIVSPH